MDTEKPNDVDLVALQAKFFPDWVDPKEKKRREDEAARIERHTCAKCGCHTHTSRFMCIECTRENKVGRTGEWDIRNPAQSKWNCLHRGAVDRGLEFKLTLDQVKQNLKAQCNYCGDFAHKHTKMSFDRVDNERGYTTDNVVPCCWSCNRAKSTLTLDEFRTMILKIAAKFENN